MQIPPSSFYRSSHPYASVSSSLNCAPVPSVSLQKAKDLERQGDDRGAFIAYLALAEFHNAEAQYCCGLMLLEGRGAERNWGQARLWLKLASQAGHTEAKKYTDQQKELTLGQKKAVVDYIRSKKTDGLECMTITLHDITMWLDSLGKYIKFNDEQQQLHSVMVLKACLISTPLSVLEECVSAYNKDLHTNIGIVVQEPPLSEDCWVLIRESLSLSQANNMGSTSKSYAFMVTRDPEI